MREITQFEFDFENNNASESGYLKFSEEVKRQHFNAIKEKKAKIKHINEKFGIQLDKNCRIKLKGVPGFIEGRLILLDDLKTIKKSSNPLLRLNTDFKDFSLESEKVYPEFQASEIENYKQIP